MTCTFQAPHKRKPRLAPRLTCLAAGLAVMVLGCGDRGTGPNGVPLGRYELRDVQGPDGEWHPLPYTYIPPLHPADSVRYRAGQFELLPDRRWRGDTDATGYGESAGQAEPNSGTFELLETEEVQGRTARILQLYLDPDARPAGAAMVARDSLYIVNVRYKRM